MEVNGLTDTTLRTEGALTYFEYELEDPEVGETYHYFTFLFKAKDAFWIFEFATQDKTASKYEEQILAWASSVTFSK